MTDTQHSELNDAGVHIAPAEPAKTMTMPRSLFVLSVFYGGMVCLAGVMGNKQVALGPLAIEAGIFTFLLLVVVSSAVTELHGKIAGNNIVKFGFIPLIFSIFMALFVLALPASEEMDPARLSAFDMMIKATPRIWIAGICAYGVSQFLNVYLFDKLSKRPGRWLAIRGVIASVFSQIIDSLIFVTVAFYGEFPIAQLLIGQLIAKTVLSIVLVPFLIVFFVKLGKWLDGEKA